MPFITADQNGQSTPQHQAVARQARAAGRRSDQRRSSPAATLKDAGVKASEIDEGDLVGGDPHAQGLRDGEAVLRARAIAALTRMRLSPSARRSGQRLRASQDVLLLDATPLSLGIGTWAASSRG
jgi:molecular chaperone DnaK (HSP70)